MVSNALKAHYETGARKKPGAYIKGVDAAEKEMLGAECVVASARL